MPRREEHVARWLDTLRMTFDRWPDNIIRTAELFPRVDIKALRDEFQLENAGAERGATELPSTAATQPDDIELSVYTRINEFHKQAADLAQERLNVYRERRTRLGVFGRSDQIKVAAEDAVADFKASVRIGLDNLYISEASAKDNVTALNNFKKHNQVSRPPHLPTSPILHAALIFVVGFAEIFLNLFFFAEGNTLFLIGGAIEALIVTVINIGAAFTAGRLALTRLIHGRPLQKLIGLVGTLIWTAFLLAFNLAVGHYRELLGGIEPEAATLLAMQHFIADPLGIVDFKSWLLILLGLLVGFFGLVDGYFFDDAIPGYGPLGRRMRQSVDTFLNERRQLIDELKERKDTAIDAITTAIQDLQKRREGYHEIMSGVRRLSAQYQAYRSHLHFVQATLIASYREANKAARATAAPSYFDVQSTLADSPIPIEINSPEYEYIDDQVAEATDALTIADKRVFGEFEKALGTLDELDEVFEPKTEPRRGVLRRVA
jgi:hypothetical protein